MNKQKQAFTLVELIVVVSILSVLGTIAFISLQGYSADSRNSVRVTDLGIIEQSLLIFEVNTGKFPLPSSSTGVIYSGSLLWNQGFFGDQPYSNLGNISNLPIDPLYNTEYNYSVLYNNKKFQLSSIIEGSLFSNNNFLISDTYALGDGNFTSYVKGNYTFKDIGIKNGNNCSLISIPSLNISNLPSNGILELFGDYSFIYSDSSNISYNYMNKINTNFTPNTFTVKEVLNNCSVNTIDELNLYISKISLAYQQLLGDPMFDETIYNFNTTSFKLGMLDELISNGISVNPDLINEVMNPTSGNIFRDTFTGIDNPDIASSHIPDTFGAWQGDNSYGISGNRLIKTLNSVGFLSPIPTLPITSIDRTILFNIVDFAGGSIFVYTNYTDTNNYQGVELRPNGYTRMKMESGVYSEYDNVAITISNNSSIEFSVTGDLIKLFINNINQGDIIDTPLLDNSNANIQMPQNAIIDNFTLIYK